MDATSANVFVSPRELPKPPSVPTFAPDVQIDTARSTSPTSIRASLTDSSVPLDLVYFQDGHTGSEYLYQSARPLTLSPKMLDYSNRQSVASSIFSIPSFPSPGKHTTQLIEIPGLTLWNQQARESNAPDKQDRDKPSERTITSKKLPEPIVEFDPAEAFLSLPSSDTPDGGGTVTSMPEQFTPRTMPSQPLLLFSTEASRSVNTRDTQHKRVSSSPPCSPKSLRPTSYMPSSPPILMSPPVMLDVKAQSSPTSTKQPTPSPPTFRSHPQRCSPPMSHKSSSPLQYHSPSMSFWPGAATAATTVASRSSADKRQPSTFNTSSKRQSTITSQRNSTTASPERQSSVLGLRTQPKPLRKAVMALRRMNSELDLQSKGNGAGKAYRAEKRYLQLGMRDTNRDSVASLASSAGDDLTPRVKGDSVTRGGVRKREDEEIIWEGGWEGEHSDAGSVRMGSKPSTPTPRGGDVAAEAEDTDEEAIYRALSASTDSERSNTSAHKRCIGFGFTNLELEGDAAETVGLGLGLGREDSDTLPPSDDNSLGVGKERKSMESKRPKLAEAKRNSSVWDDGEKFWNHFLPGQGQGQ
ncbi:hypothetical protein LTS18_009960, partial [Coniosporium uncinatum]